MPTQVNNTTTTISHSANNQTWIIAPGVNAGGGVISFFTGSAVVNYGNILTDGDAGINFLASDALALNKPGALITGVNGVNANFDLMELRNEGTIDGFQQHGVRVGGAGNHATIINSGSISGHLSGIAISSGSALVVSITNSGTISSDEQGVWLLNATGAQPVIVNSGTIRGLFNSILAEAGDRFAVTNTGTLDGNVRATSANQSDSLANSGRVLGNVFLGPGNDRYSGSGTVTGTVFGQDGNDNLSGGTVRDRLNGGVGNDTLSGNNGNDLLNGSVGNDRLLGGRGNDNLTGGSNNDVFVFNTAPNTTSNRDVVTDFNHVADTFQMENAVFTTLGAGAAHALNPAFFRAGAAALDANDHVIYNQATGALIYDSNGNAAGGAVQVAVLTNTPVLAANDFIVI